MPSQKLMLCNYTSKYTKKFLEGFYVIRTTEDDEHRMMMMMMWDDLCLDICLHCANLYNVE